MEVKRNKKIGIMVTEEENNWIKDIASRTAYKNLSTFCREMILQVCEQIGDKDLTNTTVIEMEVQD